MTERAPLRVEHTEPYTETEIHSFESIAESLVRNQNGVDLHRHVEGVLNFSELQEIASSFNIQLPPEVWNNMEATLSDNNHELTLQNFINKLSTRWMRLILIQGMMEGTATYEEILGAYFDKILVKAYDEGIETLELLASPLNMTVEGNLFYLPRVNQKQKKDVSPDQAKRLEDAEKIENTIYQRWNNHVANKMNLERTDEDLPHIEDYCQTFKNSVDKAGDKYCWGGTKEDPLADKRMEVGLRVCLRREEWAESMLTNGGDMKLDEDQGTELAPQGRMLLNRFKTLYTADYISAFDMAGMEADRINPPGYELPKYPMRKYTALLDYFEDNNMLYTLHIGEIPLAGDQHENTLRTRDNLEVVFQRPRKNLIRLGHGVRLMEENNRDLLEKAIEMGLGIEINSASNLATSAVKDISQHPGYTVHQQEDLMNLLPLLGYFTDDPAFIGGTNPLAYELHQAALHTGNLGVPGTVDDMTNYLWQNARAQAAWNIRKSRMVGKAA